MTTTTTADLLSPEAAPWTSPEGMPGRVTPAAVLLLAGLTGAVAPMSPAYGHDQSISRIPASGERLDVPDEIALTFTSQPLDVGAAVLLANGGQPEWTKGPPQLDRTSIVQQLDAGMPEGVYEVRWWMLSADGHPRREHFRFLVGASIPNDSLIKPLPDRIEPTTAVPAASNSVQTASIPLFVLFTVVGAVLAGLALILLSWRHIRLRGCAPGASNMNGDER